jgi:photosystem II stability/assembly factor-like uncharacterized protein
VEDLSLRLEFHRALDAVAPPAPWLSDQVRRALRSRRQLLQPRPRTQLRLALVLRPTTQRLVGAVLIVALILAAVGASLAIYRYTHQPVPVRPHSGALVRECGQGSLYMVDVNTGWDGTLRTTDGGTTWLDVAPAAPSGTVKGGGAVCALDANRAWVTFGTGTAPYQPDHLAVMSTGDGGQSWQQMASIPIAFPVSWRNNFSVEMDFFDAMHGWLLIEYAATPMMRVLYRTSDGGTSWAVVSSSAGLGLGDMAVGCSENGMMFSSLERGWLAWDCSRGYGEHQPSNSPVIALTNDGGRTWAPLNLESYPTGRTCTATTPVLTLTHGLLEVSCLGAGQGGWAAVYSTIDGGQNWAAHVLPMWTAVDLLDGNTAFLFEHAGQGNTLHRTVDQGENWTVVASGLFSGSTVSAFTFVDQSNGFASISSSAIPWWTHDGGKTWTAVGGHRQVGNLTCTLPSDRPSAPSVTGVRMLTSTTGWASGARRSTDGGATWLDTKPPQAKYSTSGYGEFFLDSVHVWVVESVGSPTACADHFVVYRTENGGSTWHEGAHVPIKVEGLDASDGSWIIRVFFLDANHGWLRIEPIYSLAPVGGQKPLYRTVDGGRSWTFVASETSQAANGCIGRGKFMFSSATTGWMTVGCGNSAADAGLHILVTHDAGGTWALQSIVANYCNIAIFPGGCDARLPSFFDESRGWLFDPSRPQLLLTSDGGDTWSVHGLPQLPTYACKGKFGEPETCSDQSVVSVEFINPDEGWTIVEQNSASRIVRLQHTVDGGRTWNPVSSNLVGLSVLPDAAQGSLRFMDQTSGYLWTGSRLLMTVDGGQSWSEVQMKYQ